MAKTASAVETVEKVITLNQSDVHKKVREHLSCCDQLFIPEQGEYDEETMQLIAQDVLEQLNSGGNGIYFHAS